MASFTAIVVMGLSLQSAGTPFEVHPAAETVATVGVWTLLTLTEGLVTPGLDGGPACPDTPTQRCDPADLNALDRTVVGNHSATWDRISDVTALGALALATLGSGLDAWQGDSPTPLGDFGTETLLTLESAALATAVVHLWKFAVRRPRPTQYDAERSVDHPTHQMSFPSGHTAAAAAFAASYATQFALKHPKSPWRWGVIAAAGALTAVTAYGRIGAGMHFYSDVFAGAIIGGLAGYFVPVWHLSDMAQDVSLAPTAGQNGAVGLTFSGNF